MFKEPKPMREIHEIQEKIYEEHKNLTSKEKLVAINRESEEAVKKYGLNLRKASHVK